MDTFINWLFIVLMLLVSLFIVYFMIRTISFMIKQEKKNNNLNFEIPVILVGYVYLHTIGNRCA